MSGFFCATKNHQNCNGFVPTLLNRLDRGAEVPWWANLRVNVLVKTQNILHVTSYSEVHNMYVSYYRVLWPLSYVHLCVLWKLFGSVGFCPGHFFPYVTIPIFGSAVPRPWTNIFALIFSCLGNFMPEDLNQMKSASTDKMMATEIQIMAKWYRLGTKWKHTDTKWELNETHQIVEWQYMTPKGD